MAREKKEKWQGDESLHHNPFAALMGQKKPEEAVPSELEPPKTEKTATKLPKVKSAHIEKAHRSGKTVTIVAFHGDPDETQKASWLKQAKRDFGCGGQIEDGQVVLQGNLVERLMSR